MKKEIIGGLEWEIGPNCLCGSKTVKLTDDSYGCLKCRATVIKDKDLKLWEVNICKKKL